MARGEPKEFVCIVCGKKGLDYSGGSKKYCCKWCRDKARGHIGGYTCKYNETVNCTIPDCSRCGWNPTVAKERSEKLLRQFR